MFSMHQIIPSMDIYPIKVQILRLIWLRLIQTWWNIRKIDHHFLLATMYVGSITRMLLGVLNGILEFEEQSVCICTFGSSKILVGELVDIASNISSQGYIIVYAILSDHIIMNYNLKLLGFTKCLWQIFKDHFVHDLNDFWK